MKSAPRHDHRWVDIKRILCEQELRAPAGTICSHQYVGYAQSQAEAEFTTRVHNLALHYGLGLKIGGET